MGGESVRELDLHGMSVVQARVCVDAALRRAMENSLQYMEGAGFHLHPATGEALAFLRKEIHQ